MSQSQRIVGVDVPNNKPAWIALTYIHGVGVYRSKKILAEIGVDEYKIPVRRAQRICFLLKVA